jgi:hypothetical protein
VGWDEAGEFDDSGDCDGERGEGSGAESREEGGEEPVEGCCPEDGAEVFVEEPWEREREEADGQADGDRDDEDGEGGKRSAHIFVVDNV